MPAIILLATQLIPLLVAAGMDLAPTIEALINANDGNIEETKALLHRQRAEALAVINDRSRDVR